MSDDEFLSVMFSGDAGEIRRALSEREPNAVVEGQPILLWATSAGTADAVQAVIEKGADPDAKSETGETALLMAAYSGKLDVVRVLMHSGANVNAADEDGQTALMAAAKSGSLDVVRELVAAGARLDQCDSHDRSVMHWVMAEGDHAEVVNYLLAQGAPKDGTSQDGASPYDYALSLGRSRSLALLVGQSD